jgi:pimeloyl-ACP methyl ester carboxylesterase
MQRPNCLSSIAVAACLILSGSPTLWTQSSESSLGTHGFAQSNDVKIHYVTMGEGPLVVMIHGFPDYWYTWRKQVPAIARNFQVMAIDQRGYNESDQPERVANYSMDKLVGDVKAVIEHFGRQQATIVGHDWGGRRGLVVCHDLPANDRTPDRSELTPLQRTET